MRRTCCAPRRPVPGRITCTGRLRAARPRTAGGSSAEWPERPSLLCLPSPSESFFRGSEVSLISRLSMVAGPSNPVRKRIAAASVAFRRPAGPSTDLRIRSHLAWVKYRPQRGVALDAPDHPTLSRRSQSLAIACRRRPSSGPLHLLVDSTGLSMVGEGAWAAVNHGGRGPRGGKKRPLAVDRVGVIVAHALTEPTGDDATLGIALMETVDNAIARVPADTTDETVACYEAAGMRDATGVVPPVKTARGSRRRSQSRARDRTITEVRTRGRRRWKQEAGSPLQARVEHACFRDQSMIGDRLRARSRGGRVAESVGACHVLNQRPERGRPESYSLSRCLAAGLGSLTVSVESCTSAARIREVVLPGGPTGYDEQEREHPLRYVSVPGRIDAGHPRRRLRRRPARRRHRGCRSTAG